LGLRLDAGASYAMLVSAPSVEAPSLKRVTPGNPDASYLVHKIEGTATVGSRMPLGGPSLPMETIAVIRQWIVDGAQQAAVSAAATSAQQLTRLDSAWPLPAAKLSAPPREILLTSNGEIDTTLLDAGVLSLRRSGGDGDFHNGNEQVISVTLSLRSLEPSVIAIIAPAEQWVADWYELRISGGPPLALADRAARPIDGDRDGVPGGDFVLRFQLEMEK
jgi:hypothetical protein